MEILDMKFAGIPISAWLTIVLGVYFLRQLAKEWQRWKERRAWRRDFEEKEKIWMSENHWEPKIINGVDCGEWVRNDGAPPDLEEWTPAGALLDRLAERGPSNG